MLSFLIFNHKVNSVKMKLFSLMVLLCASLGGYAQDIKGRVVEQENGKKVGLPGANVYWAGTTDGVVTLSLIHI